MGSRSPAVNDPKNLSWRGRTIARDPITTEADYYEWCPACRVWFDARVSIRSGATGMRVISG